MVQGLGKQQSEAKKFTESKIVAFLSVQPFIFEDLFKSSKIRRNTLRQRLNSLVNRKIVIRHQYSMPYNHDCYGYLYHPFRITPYAKYKKYYYLLDWSNTNSKDLLNFYYDKSDIFEKDNESKRIKEKNENDSDKIIRLRNEEKQIIEKIIESENNRQQKIAELNKLREELTNLDDRFDDEYFLHRDELIKMIKLDNLLIKQKLHIRRTINKLKSNVTYEYHDDNDKKEILYLIQYYKRKGYSVYDIMVKMTIDVTLLIDHHTSLVDYLILWELIH